MEEADGSLRFNYFFHFAIPFLPAAYAYYRGAVSCTQLDIFIMALVFNCTFIALRIILSPSQKCAINRLLPADQRKKAAHYGQLLNAWRISFQLTHLLALLLALLLEPSLTKPLSLFPRCCPAGTVKHQLSIGCRSE